MKRKTPAFPEKTFGTEMDATINAAWLYYHHNLTQAQIARQLHVSRPTVANLLSRARSRGIVSITLRPDLLSRLSLAQELRVRFGLQDACIVPTPDGATSLEIRQALGKAGALYLENTLQPGEVFATAWGATVLEVARALSGKRFDSIVLAQAIGCLNSGESFNPIRLAGIMAEKLGAKVYHLPVPAVVSSARIRDILLEDRNIRACLEMARSSSRAMIGIGKVSHDATVVSAGFFDPMMIDELKAKGAVGDISCRYFDIQGRPVLTDFDNRVISLTFDELRKIKPVIAVGGGEDKVSAILGALRTGCIDVIVSDERTAQKVLAMDTATAPKHDFSDRQDVAELNPDS
ncbi:MAG TPA: sugar-binding transcriptional regulator [Chthoniobacterales bacterium]|jgi:DNA-binding transcriptional regulator LsrR (DeoR family)|nr:sugar-binding transcriptional regulator [Chthoniobacterales bacterium]